MTIQRKIIDAHGETYLRKSALRADDGESVFEWALKDKGYGTVLEIGTYRGASAAAMAQYCREVITVDLLHGKREANGETFDRYQFWESLGIQNILLFLVEDDVDKAEKLAALTFDFAFIDGDHGDGVARDFQLVRHCGRVLFHDYCDDERPEHRYVRDIVKSLPADEVSFNGMFALWEKRA